MAKYSRRGFLKKLAELSVVVPVVSNELLNGKKKPPETEIIKKEQPAHFTRDYFIHMSGSSMAMGKYNSFNP